MDTKADKKADMKEDKKAAMKEDMKADKKVDTKIGMTSYQLTRKKSKEQLKNQKCSNQKLGSRNQLC